MQLSAGIEVYAAVANRRLASLHRSRSRSRSGSIYLYACPEGVQAAEHDAPILKILIVKDPLYVWA